MALVSYQEGGGEPPNRAAATGGWAIDGFRLRALVIHMLYVSLVSINL